MADSLGDLVVQLNADFGDVSSQLEDLVGNFDNLGDSASKTADHLSDVQGAADDVGGAFEALETKGGDLLKTLLGFAGVTLSIAGALKLLQEALGLSATAERATVSLAAIRSSEHQAGVEMAGLTEMATKFGVSFDSVVQVDQRFAAFGLSVDQTTQAMHMAIEAAAAMNSTVENTGRTLDLVVSSGMASRRIMSSLGIDMNDLARAMGVTETEATRLFRTLDVSDRLEAIQIAMKKFGDIAEDQAKGMASSWQRFGDAFKKVLQDVGDSMASTTTWIADKASTWMDKLHFHGTTKADETKDPFSIQTTQKGLYELEGIAKRLGVDYEGILKRYQDMADKSHNLTINTQAYGQELQNAIERQQEQIRGEAAYDKAVADTAAHKAEQLKKDVQTNREREFVEDRIKNLREAGERSLDIIRTNIENQAKLHQISEATETARLIAVSEQRERIQVDAIKRLMALPGKMVEGIPEDRTKEELALQGELTAVQAKGADERARLGVRDPALQQKLSDEEIKAEEQHQKDLLEVKRSWAENAFKIGLTDEEASIQQLRDYNTEELNITLDALKQQKAIKGKTAADSKKLDDDAITARDASTKRDAALSEQAATYRMKTAEEQRKLYEIDTKSAEEHGLSQIDTDRKVNDELLSQHRITAEQHYAIQRDLNAKEDKLQQDAMQAELDNLEMLALIDKGNVTYGAQIDALIAKMKAYHDKAVSRDVTDAVKEQDRAWKDLGMTSTAALKTIADGAQENMDAIRAQGASVYQLAQAYQKVLEAQIKQNTEMGRDSNEQSVRLLELKAATDLWNASLNNLGKSLNDLYADFKKDFGALAGEVAKAIVDGEKFGKLWHTIWTQFATDILTVVIQALERLILKMVVVQIVIAALNKLTGGALDASNADDAKKRIATSADEAAAGAAASVFENYPWPSSLELAPIAAEIAGGMTEALGHSFDMAETGADVARTGPVIAHAGETILSAGQTSKLGSMIDSGELGAKGGDRGGDTHFHINGATKSLMDEVLNYQIKNGRRSGVPW